MENNQRPDLEKRLQAVAYMRQSADLAQERLCRAGEILGYTKADLYPESEAALLHARREKDEQNKTGLTFAGSIACRCCLVLLLLLFFRLGRNAPDGAVDAMREKCTSMIGIDYSEKLFDFIQEIPYTFDYEKTNA